MMYTYDGQTVYAPVAGKWLLCVVVCACGDLARVVNELHRIDRWFRVEDLKNMATRRSQAVMGPE